MYVIPYVIVISGQDVKLSLFGADLNFAFRLLQFKQRNYRSQANQQFFSCDTAFDALYRGIFFNGQSIK